MLLAGATKPDRSLEEGPDEACIPVLQARGFGSGSTTRNCKIGLVTETATKASTTAGCDGLQESSETRMTSSSESRKEASDRKMEVPSAETKSRMKNKNHSWGTIQRLASDRQGWRSFVAALYASWRDG